MMTKTPEERIAEWLGINVYEARYFTIDETKTELASMNCKEFKDWLHSASGEAAMMGRLWKDRILVKYWHSGQDGSVMSCNLNNNGWTQPRINFNSTFFNNRRKALIDAILAMLEEE